MSGADGPDGAVDVRALVETRVRAPGAILEAARSRRRRPLADASGRLLVVAADHPARGVLGTGGDPYAMADRGDLLRRLVVALSRPGVDGVLATPEVVEDLLLLGALDGKVVLGSTNRGGLAGSVFEIDDRYTAYDAASIAGHGLDGGKLLLRIDPADPATAGALEAAARTVGELADHGLITLVEPFWTARVEGRLRTDLSPDAMMRAIVVASALGPTSAYTWLKVPIVADMARVMATSTLPALVLGGEVSDDPDATYASWAAALDLPSVRGLAVGRSLLHPADGDVARAVDTAAALVHGAGRHEGRDDETAGRRAGS